MRASLTDVAPNDFSMRDVAHLIFRRRIQVLTAALTTVTVVAVAVLLREPVYEATATLYIVRNLPPIAATGPSTFNLILDRREVLSSEAELLTSRPVAEQVADVLLALPPRPRTAPSEPPRLRDRLAGTLRSVLGLLTWPSSDPPLSPRDALIKDLLEIEAVPSSTSDFVTVRFQSADPELAALVVNTFAKVYLDHRLRLFQRPGLQTFYDEQVARARAEVDTLTAEAAALKAKTGVVAPATQLTLELQQVAALRTNLGLARSEIQETQERIAALRARIDQEPEAVVTSRVTERNPLLLEFEKRRASLEAERAAELNRFQEGSGPIQEIDRMLLRLEEQRRHEPETLVASESMAQNGLRSALLADLYRAEAELTAKTARRRALEAQLADVEPAVVALDADAAALEQVTASLASANRVYARYVEQREEARIAAATDPGMTNAQLVGAAHVPLRPATVVGRRYLILAGLLGGLIMGALTALIGALFGQTLDRREDAERALGLPVLASIPELQLR